MSSNTSTLPAQSTKSVPPTTATLREDLQTLKSDLDTLLAHATELTDVELHDAQERILAKFSSLRFAAKGIAVEAGRQFHHGVEVTTGYVKEKPIQSIALAVGFGTLLGVLISGRK
ncbi:DUF883 family protein [Herminiimonas fonticola]|uniref:ElaB/YqjD/DUF883 family membrane-anchored ribosome-binding protein n=1 Tax=Herminiimonas fonticola TaxID=303380 RepID=A0A4R6GHZ0_9BURK|nr:DUF883 family protein [Herminiimonas fonticola]RBA25459.1 hypothetical protein Hfont_1092 [Herminiimonas fonticola]TDN94572.1 ElaB/YqjD/DUF883 family membrane-anchored ribosome-binding protein [Herminiimonas fonticola]